MFQQDAGLPAGSGQTEICFRRKETVMAGNKDRPFTRQEVVADIVETLTSGSGCGIVLVGDHGAGKSFIAQRALEQLGDEYLVVQVRGSSISSKLPYGALSVLLNDLDASHLEHPLMVLRGLTQLLHNKSEGRPIVLFVDNAHDLDELSSMMVAQLSAGVHVTLLAACVDMPHIGGDIMGLWKDDLLRRVDLGPVRLRRDGSNVAPRIRRPVLPGRCPGALECQRGQRPVPPFLGPGTDRARAQWSARKAVVPGERPHRLNR